MISKPSTSDASPQLRQRASPLEDGAIVLLLGMPGQGKSTLMGRAIARDVVTHGRRAVLLDPTGELLERVQGKSAAVGKECVPAAQCRTVHSAAEARDAFAGIARGLGALFDGRPPPRVVALRARRPEDEDLVAADFLAMMDSDAAKGWVFGADQAESLFPNTQQRGAPRRALAYCRNRKQTLYLAVHRPTILSTLARSNAKEVAVFRLRAEEDVRLCASFGCAAQFEHAAALVKYSFIHCGFDHRPTDTLPVFDARTAPLPF